ncbi:chondroitinase-B domain-containing protein [Vibrio taketomensis]|uniref:chondroitinase-B domain-containing protein n=1 Tax=Vibrio taketomensis TaxID=2572923 RepID=UPI00138A3DE5|nr:chondroitinase-B domain-containing protein [Vibrio taketomensis]
MLCCNSSYAIDLDDISRDGLLSSERLSPISSETLTTHSEQTVQLLKEKLESAKDGDIISIANGKYPNLGSVKVSANNLIIKADNAGQAWLTGLVQLNINGNHTH